MGIFTRFREIINSNINAMLDNAEDPEKLIKLMIREIEDTLVEIKSSCAGVIAARKKVERYLEEVRIREQEWNDRAKLAVKKGRDDLAREALMEKRNYTERAESLEKEVKEHGDLTEQYQDDIRQLEDKLKTAREKQRMLVQRHIRARRKKRVQEEIRRIDTSQTLAKFDELENRIERMEAEADLVNFGRKSTLEEEFDKLGLDDEIEKELQALKSPLEKKE
ncbi:phage shock protein PspA [Desulfonema magnum]|uniref:Phage shock protein A n=1 Tax=Desulfonema magnum TaxID=45655 RepID=A0A975BVT0_9BACT|nr:phage shock protein PspA [Desulfonema magnum]QTA92644.1 Phage shock protein A [Desulfonema magnum]